MEIQKVNRAQGFLVTATMFTNIMREVEKIKAKKKEGKKDERK